MALKDRCVYTPVSCYVERLAGSKGQVYTVQTPRVADLPCVSLMRGLNGAWIFDLHQQSFVRVCMFTAGPIGHAV